MFYDIESEGLPLAQIEKLMPEEWPTGNTKDPVKLAAVIEEKKKEWLDRTALRAITGRIIAVTSAVDDNEPEMSANADELTLIQILLTDLKQCIGMNGQAYAWNGSGFDLLFLCQRAAVYGVPAFADLTVNVRGKFYWNECLIDPKQVWSFYSTDHTGTSLKSVAIALGVGEKSGSGKDFAKLLVENPVEAKRYALADITLLRSIVKRMGI